MSASDPEVHDLYLDVRKDRWNMDEAYKLSARSLMTMNRTSMRDRPNMIVILECRKMFVLDRYMFRTNTG
jgi:Flp pilus assembly CpaF family ATPase